MPYSASTILRVAIVSLAVSACSQKDTGQGDVTNTPADAVSAEIAARPAIELEQAHLSESLLSTYQQSCGTCHARGVINAPKTGDANAWAPRMAKGMETLLVHVRQGFKAMPPMGLCYNCSDEDFEGLIRYMAAPQATHDSAQ